MSNQITSTHLQEDLLILLCFDNDRARTLSALLKPEYFDAIYAKIVEAAISHIEKHGDAPGFGMSDILEKIISKRDTVGAAVERALLNLYASKDNVNANHTIDRLNNFIRRQTIRGGVIAASKELGEDATDKQIDEAERILRESLRQRMEVFEPGIFLDDADAVLKCLDTIEDQTFGTGIKELDAKQAGPVRGGLHLLVAPAKAGKTAWLCHIGKIAIRDRMRVAHISLEMSEERVIGRYMQGLFSIAKRDTPIERTQWTLDDLDRIVDFIQVSRTPPLSFDAPDIKSQLRKRIKKLKRDLKRIVVKSFPTGTLTVEQLSAYLDLLADSKGFTPDIILLDYADLMKFSGRDFRIALGNLYKELRGLAGERDIAVATVSQSNRQASRAGRTTAEDVAEDWSKIATADTILTYASSSLEKEMGLARITVAAHRNDEDKFSVVVEQNYASGQFALSSTPVNSIYLDKINTKEKRDKKDDDV